MSDDIDDLRGAMPQELDARQTAALAEAATWVGDGVEAVGLGETPDGTDCVVVYTSGLPVDLPEEVGGLPVRVEASGPILALEVDPDDAEAGD